MSRDPLIFFQEWYQSKCDGKWEHEYGFSIRTLDNPGWKVSLTGASGMTPMALEVNKGENWMIISADEKEFKGYGSPGNLHAILEHAHEWLA